MNVDVYMDDDMDDDMNVDDDESGVGVNFFSRWEINNMTSKIEKQEKTRKK